jgi:hypothetical protein
MVQQIPRDEWLDEYWPGLYRAGDHVLTLGPTQRAGKTHLNFQLLQSANRPDLSPVIFCMKPRDNTVSEWSEKLGFKEIDHWPPTKYPWQNTPPGHTLWPQHPYDIEDANEHIGDQFKRAMLDRYKAGDSILFLDEIYGICAELGLSKELISIITRGGGMGVGAWMASQRPAGTHQGSLPGFVFNCPRHYYLAKDNNKANREKYADLAGGFDPRHIEELTLGLRQFEFLYLNSDGNAAIVGA